ncbi:calcyphosin-2-like [Glandiceps talaboti]
MKTDAEQLAMERRRHQMVETVMVDQLSRAVISDPEQDVREGSYSTPVSSYGRGRVRTLHESKVRTTGTATEQLLSKRLMFSARLLTRNGRDAIRELCGFYFMHDNTMTLYEYRQFGKRSSALPFVQRGSYKHVIGRRKGYSYVIQDIYVGSSLSFETCSQTSLPEAVQKHPIMLVRVTDVDERAKANFVFDGHIARDQNTYAAKMRPPFTNLEYEDMKLTQEIQSEVQQQLKKRGVKTMTGLGQHFRKLDRTGDGKLDKIELRKALQLYHVNIEEEKFQSLWTVLDQNGDGCIDYGEFVRGFIGEMTEWRKSLVRKVFQKIDSSKTGYISFNDIKKFFMAHAHPQVTAGQASEMDVLNDLLDSFEHCKRSGEISYNDFEDYYEGLSLSINDDSKFADIVTRCWGL